MPTSVRFISPPKRSPLRRVRFDYLSTRKPTTPPRIDHYVEGRRQKYLFDTHYGINSVEGTFMDKVVPKVIDEVDNYYANPHRLVNFENDWSVLDIGDQLLLQILRESHVTGCNDFSPTPSILSVLKLIAGHINPTLEFTFSAMNLLRLGLIKFPLEITEKGRLTLICHEFAWLVESQLPSPPQDGTRDWTDGFNFDLFFEM